MGLRINTFRAAYLFVSSRSGRKFDEIEYLNYVVLHGQSPCCCIITTIVYHLITPVIYIHNNNNVMLRYVVVIIFCVVVLLCCCRCVADSTRVVSLIPRVIHTVCAHKPDSYYIQSSLRITKCTWIVNTSHKLVYVIYKNYYTQTITINRSYTARPWSSRGAAVPLRYGRLVHNMMYSYLLYRRQTITIK